MDERRVLVFPPTRRDGEASQHLLEQAHLRCTVCDGATELACAINEGAGALVVTELALNSPQFEVVLAALRAQPAWSDLPVVLLCASGAQTRLVARTVTALTNLTLVDRPASARSLISAIQSALRGRERQYEMRSQFEELRHVQETLRARERELRGADRRKDEFLAMLAHELRNPLAPIRSASELLIRVQPDQQQVHGMAQILKRQVSHLTRIVDDLLDVSRITQGRIDLQRQPVDIATVLADALESVEPLMRDKHHDISRRVPAKQLYVDGDAARLVQCVSNLLINSAKYTDRQGQICLEAHAEGAEAVISVIDNGVGIPPELLPQIFDLFVQNTRSLDRAQGGLGIGLSVVRRLVEMHGGRVAAYSEGTGRGARFEIRLPRISAPTPTAKASPSLVALPQRILVVDDNQDAANSLAMILNASGHEVHAVYAPEDALEQIASGHFEVVLLDIGLPRMNGYQIAQKLRAAGSAVRLIALTGYGQREDVAHARNAGFDAHLVKPVNLHDLEALLSAHPTNTPLPGTQPSDQRVTS